jgi:hypothetical protein
LILHAATWCHRAIAGNAVGSPVAAIRTLPPANSGDAFLEQDRCKIPPISFAIYDRRLSGDDRPATDWEFAEQVRLIGMSTKKHNEREERCDHHFPGRPSFGRRRAARRFREGEQIRGP